MTVPRPISTRGYKVHVDTTASWSTNTVDVYIYAPGPEHTTRVVQVGRAEDGQTTFTEVDVQQGEQMPGPSFSLPDFMFKALIAAGAEVLPPDRAQASHLADAITVRDRLLTLIEKDQA